MVGALGVTLNYSIFFVFLRVLEVHYLLASAAGFTLPIVVVFFLNKRFTFNVHEKEGTTGMLIRNFLVALFSLVINQVSMAVQVEIFSCEQPHRQGYHPGDD